MKLNFYNENIYSSGKYLEYEIKEIDSKKYIVAKTSKCQNYDFFESCNDITLDLLNLGKETLESNGNIENNVLEYVNKYGLIGFINDFPINRYYILDDNIAIRENSYINNLDVISNIELEKYLKEFFPFSKKEEIKNKIKICRENIFSNSKEKYITNELNFNLIYSKEYTESIDMIVEYAKYNYQLLQNILSSDNNKFDFINKFEVNNIIFNLGLEDNRTNIKTKISYLKQGIDYTLLNLLASEISPLKTCKFCGKAFIANNPKAEYDSMNCKNKANVYKSRSKN